MGMVFVTHMALLLVYNPPKALKERAIETDVSKMITMASLVMFLGWNMLAIILAFVVQLTRTSDSLANPTISIAPSPIYLFIVLFITVALSIPAFIFFRDRKQHLLGEILVFIGVFGFLIPNLVVAIHRSQI